MQAVQTDACMNMVVWICVEKMNRNTNRKCIDCRLDGQMDGIKGR